MLALFAKIATCEGLIDRIDAILYCIFTKTSIEV